MSYKLAMYGALWTLRRMWTVVKQKKFSLKVPPEKVIQKLTMKEAYNFPLSEVLKKYLGQNC